MQMPGKAGGGGSPESRVGAAGDRSPEEEQEEEDRWLGKFETARRLGGIDEEERCSRARIRI